MDDWKNCGVTKNKMSPTLATITALDVGATAVFDAPKARSYNQPATAAGRLQRTTNKLFRWRRVGETVEVERIR